MKHSYVIDNDTIDADLEKHAMELNPAKVALQTNRPSVSSRAPTVETTSVFKEGTLSQLKKISAIISRKMERLINRLMSRQAIEDATARQPHIAQLSLDILKGTCTGDN